MWASKTVLYSFTVVFAVVYLCTCVVAPPTQGKQKTADTKKSSSDITTIDAVAGNSFFESTGSGYELTSQNPAYIEGDTSVVDESNQGTPGSRDPVYWFTVSRSLKPEDTRRTHELSLRLNWVWEKAGVSRDGLESDVRNRTTAANRRTMADFVVEKVNRDLHKTEGQMIDAMENKKLPNCLKECKAVSKLFNSGQQEFDISKDFHLCAFMTQYKAYGIIQKLASPPDISVSALVDILLVLTDSAAVTEYLTMAYIKDLQEYEKTMREETLNASQ
uniref:Uncharacterized protein n=1 Tax=Magallana gigas TaxID=29159 RepID=K1QDT2_MAGGI